MYVCMFEWIFFIGVDIYNNKIRTMGAGNTTQKPVDLVINNPVFNQSKLIMKNGQRRIQVLIATDSKGYQKFVELQ